MKNNIIKHYRTANADVSPNSNDLEYGEIAIKYVKDNETIFIKNNENEIAEFKDKKYIDKKIEGIETIIEDDELITATAINKIFKSSGFDENGDSTLQGGVSLTSAIEKLQNEWGHQGPQGVKGDNGINGSQGPQGASGTNGSQGPQGANGAQGASGTNGSQGRQGPRGIDLTSGNYLPLSGGTMDNQNVVTNLNADLLDGYDGSAYSKTGHSHDELYYTESEIDLKIEEIETIIEDNELITSKAINQIVKSTGLDESGNSTLDGGISLTSAIEKLQNEWGHQGPQGANGVQGPQGANGSQGTQGANGSQGPQGANGAQGASGANGSQGPQGANGAQGASGANGSQGPKGADGTNGVNGSQGRQGPRGIDLTSGNYLPLSGGTMNNQNVVTNLNADLLDGYDGSEYSKTGHSHDDLYYTESEIDLKFEEIDYITAVDTTETIDDISNDFITTEQLDARDYATNSSVNSQINTVNDSITDVSNRLTKVEKYTSHDMRASVLWLGTSIPAGDINIDPQQNNTYPKMVADALGFDLYNMAKAGSLVSWYPQSPNWTTSSQVAAEFATAYCLSATRQEIYDKYYNVLNTIRQNEGLSTTWRDNYLNDFMDSSFETRIIPYIDGTIAKCDGVVIDHGFNDRSNIFNVCNQHVTADKDSISVWGPGSDAEGVEYPVIGGNAGWWWLTHLADNRYYDGEVYMNTVYAVANGLVGNDTGGMRGEYFGAMAYIIAKIQQVDPRIRIVIGNYFSQDYGTALGDGMNSFQTKYILQANQSISDYYGFPCVNVYKHTGLRNRTIRKPDGTTISDMYWFCPDGVHPSSDTTGLSNSIIASAYVAQIKGCFFKLS